MLLISTEKLLNLIKSCDFLSPEMINKWENNLKSLPVGFFSLIYRTFLEAKEKYDQTYVQFELSHDEDGSYKNFINQKSKEAVTLIKATKLRNLGDQLMA